MVEIPNIAEAKPNQLWIWVGGGGFLLCLFAGLISFLGISGFGIHLSEQTPVYAFIFLLIGMIACLFCMYYGTRLAKNREIALERRKANRPVSEPTQGDLEFWEEFKEGQPMTAKMLEKFSTAHDLKKTKNELLASLAYQRMEGWIRRGKAVEYGNAYYTREGFEQSQRDMTVIGG